MAFISPHVNAKAVQAGASYDLSEPSPSGSESGGGDLPGWGGISQISHQSLDFLLGEGAGPSSLVTNQGRVGVAHGVL